MKSTQLVYKPEFINLVVVTIKTKIQETTKTCHRSLEGTVTARNTRFMTDKPPSSRLSCPKNLP